MIPNPFLRPQPGADGLVEGCYLLKVGEGRVDVPIRIWFGPPIDPIDGTELDRRARWQIHVNGIEYGDPDYPPVIAGRPVDHLDQIWPRCATMPIPVEEYNYRVDRAEYAEEWDQDDPFARTGGRVDPMQAAMPF